MTTLRKYLILLMFGLAFVAAGCSGGGENDSAPTSAEQAADYAGTNSGEAPRETSAKGAGSDGAARPPVAQRAVISTATVELSSDDVAETRQEIDKIVTRHQGEISSSETSTEENEQGDTVPSYLKVVLRVPSADFAATQAELEKAGTLVSSTSTSEDVTTQVLDVDARVRAQERALRRIERLFDRAGSLSDVISIESEITRRQEDLDSMKAQQAYLEDATSLSTITVFVSRDDVAPKPKPEEDQNAFVGGLSDGWAALSGLGAVLAMVAGALLPFAIVGLVLGVPLWLVLRRWLRSPGVRGDQPTELGSGGAD